MGETKMTCDKCENVHEAQKEGKTQDACNCTCHEIGSTPLTNPIGWQYYPTYCTPCCPCTDPNNLNKPMHLVCYCNCHGCTYTTDTGTAPPYGGQTVCFTYNGTVCKDVDATVRKGY